MTELASFLDSTPSPAHLSLVATKMLKDAGYQEVPDFSCGELPTKGFQVRHNRSIIAYEMDQNPEAAVIMTSFNDFLGFGLRNDYTPQKSVTNSIDLMYCGDPGNHTCSYIDRDLKIAGPVIIYRDGHYEMKIIDSVNPIGTMLGVSPQLVPTIGTKPEYTPASNYKLFLGPKNIYEIISELCGCKPEEIVEQNLRVVDSEKASIAGDIILSGRLANYACVYSSLNGFINSKVASKTIKVLFIADGLNQGVESCTGTSSTFMEEFLHKVFKDNQSYKPKSIIAINRTMGAPTPYEMGKSEQKHTLLIGKGIASYVSGNSQFQTDDIGKVIIRKTAEKAGINVQQFANKNTIRFGAPTSTTYAIKLGIRNFDIGLPIIGPGNCREVMSWKDAESMIKFVVSFYENFNETSPHIQ